MGCKVRAEETRRFKGMLEGRLKELEDEKQTAMQHAKESARARSYYYSN